MLLPILCARPGYVPYPCLLALLETGRMPDLEQEAELRQRYQESLDADTQDTLLAPLRARLADPQRKLALFGLRPGAVYQTGLLLMQAPRRPEGATIVVQPNKRKREGEPIHVRTTSQL